jgi:hypothetical protein
MAKKIKTPAEELGLVPDATLHSLADLVGVLKD